MPERTKTTQEIADLFDVTVRTVTNWTKGGCPHNKPAKRTDPNKFDEGEVAAWMQANGITGDMNRFFAGDPSAGAFMAGHFPVIMFGLPGACLAMLGIADQATGERQQDQGEDDSEAHALINV